MNRAPTRTTEFKFTSFHPQKRGLFSFISQLVIRQPNSCDGLVGFKGGSKSLSVPKTAAQETYRGRRISPSYQLRSNLGVAEGLLKLLHSCLLTEGFQTHHGYKLWNHWNRSIGSRWFRWSSKLPPLRPPGLDSLIANLRVVVEVKFFDGRVDTQGIGQDLQKMSAKRQADDSWQNRNQRSRRRHSGNRIRVGNLTKLLTHSAMQALREKTNCRPKTRSKMWTILSATKK